MTCPNAMVMAAADVKPLMTGTGMKSTRKPFERKHEFKMNYPPDGRNIEYKCLIAVLLFCLMHDEYTVAVVCVGVIVKTITL